MTLTEAQARNSAHSVGVPAGMPERIQVGPYIYIIQCSREAIDKRRLECHTGNIVGSTDTWNGRIALAPEQAPGMIRGVLIHELLHACADVAGWGEETLTEEQVALRLMPVLLDTLRRNKPLVAYLMEADT